MSQHTFLSISDELIYYGNEIEKLSMKVVANRKKFHLVSTLFKKFNNDFACYATSKPLSPEQVCSYQEAVAAINELLELIANNYVQCWVHTALENPSAHIASEICNIVHRLNESLSVIDQKAAAHFDATLPQWLQFHIIDLKAIYASFNQYICSKTADDATVNVMQKKLKSISEFFNEYENMESIPNIHAFSPIPIHYQNWRLNHSDFTEEREIGSGVSSVVYYGHDKRNSNEVAVKKLKFMKLSGKKLSAFQREVTILATVDYPTILKFVGATDVAPYCILTEWMDGGSLYHELHKKHNLDQTQLTIVAIDMARGMQYLHSRQIIHRDLKSLNVLLDSDGNAKICDFGFSKKTTKKEELMTQNVGTPHWMAPELLGGATTYDEKIDVYAYGIVLWEILTKKIPYSNLETTQIVGQVLLNDIRPPIPNGTSSELKELIEICWARDPKLRPSFNQIMKKWRTGNIIFPDADKELVLKHIKNTIDETERATNNVESQLDSKIPFDVKDLYETLKRDGIPDELTERCWVNLNTISHENKIELYIRCMALFLKSSYKSKAAEILRQMEPNSIPFDVAVNAVRMIPTGDEEIDENLTYIGCKNGAASEAVIYCLQHEHLKLSLEVIARNGIIEDRRKEIIDRCLCFLKISDPMLNVASFRCLISINEAHQVPFDSIRTHLKSRNNTLMITTHLVLAKMAEEGVKIENDILDLCISKWDSLSIAGTVTINSCENKENATYLLNRLTYGNSPPPDISTKILVKSYKFQELHHLIKSAMLQLQFLKASPDSLQAISILSKKLE